MTASHMPTSRWTAPIDNWPTGIPHSNADTELGAAFGCHHAGVPGRVPDEFDLDIIHSLQAEQGHLHTVGDALVHGATGGGKGHCEEGFAASELEAVDES